MVAPEQERRILWTIRHGHPDVPKNRPRVSRDEFNRYLDAYDAAGISPSEAARLKTLYASYPRPDLVLSSDLRRAKETADLFARGAEVRADPVFREVPVFLPAGESWFLNGRWPGEVWWSYLRVAWFRGAQRETPEQSRARVQEALALIRTALASAGAIGLVSHAGFLLLLVDSLQRRGLISGPRLPSIGFGRATAYHWLGELKADG